MWRQGGLTFSCWDYDKLGLNNFYKFVNLLPFSAPSVRTCPVLSSISCSREEAFKIFISRPTNQKSLEVLTRPEDTVFPSYSGTENSYGNDDELWPQSGPQPFGTRDGFCGRRVLHRWGRGDCFGMILVHCIYCALCFYCYYVGPTPDHQALDPWDWGALF